MAEVRLTKAADRDFQDIAQYSAAQFGDQQTCIYLAGLRAALGNLLANPGLGAPEDGLRVGTRCWRYLSHRIYYRRDGEDIIIQRVLHSARNVNRNSIR